MKTKRRARSCVNNDTRNSAFFISGPTARRRLYKPRRSASKVHRYYYRCGLTWRSSSDVVDDAYTVNNNNKP